MATRPFNKNQWAVIFDMDGVLIDSYRAHFLSWKQIAQSLGHDMGEDEFAATFGQTNRDILRHLYPSLSPESCAALGEKKEETFREIIKKDFPAMDGASELLTELHKAGAILAVGSSAPPENIRTVLDHLPGSEYVAAVTNGSEITRGKPDPEVFLKTCEKIGLPSSRCIVVEDAPVGVSAARAAGCAVIAITGTATKEQLNEADLVVTSLRQLSLRAFIGLLESIAEHVTA